jgi:Predicted Zn-ribbon RNA-binding protein with a function in translation
MREIVKKLILGLKVTCPDCGRAVLVSLHKTRDQNTRYKCPSCGKIYRVAKMI